MVTIYALTDNGVIFYIGQTMDLKQRIYNHKNEINNRTEKSKRINEILINGRELDYIILDTCENRHGLIIERHYIVKYLSEGHKLCNNLPPSIYTPNNKTATYKYYSKLEKTVLQLIANDFNTKEIAEITNKQKRAIESIKSKIKRKANVKSIAALIRNAYNNKIIK